MQLKVLICIFSGIFILILIDLYTDYRKKQKEFKTLEVQAMGDIKKFLDKFPEGEVVIERKVLGVKTRKVYNNNSFKVDGQEYTKIKTLIDEKEYINDN